MAVSVAQLTEKPFVDDFVVSRPTGLVQENCNCIKQVLSGMY